eukprot:3680583-Pleurochrysis_carterae.AAC.2
MALQRQHDRHRQRLPAFLSSSDSVAGVACTLSDGALMPCRPPYRRASTSAPSHLAISGATDMSR